MRIANRARQNDALRTTQLVGGGRRLGALAGVFRQRDGGFASHAPY
jgi:hypothetical protein